jgi:hypothetical protein
VNDKKPTRIISWETESKRKRKVCLFIDAASYKGYNIGGEWNVNKDHSLNDAQRGKTNYWRKNWPTGKSSSKNPTCAGLGSNPGLPQYLPYREVTLVGTTAGRLFLLMVYICLFEWNYEMKCCCLLGWLCWTGGVGANVAGKGRGRRLCLKRVFFLGGGRQL